jgi:phytoene dehydrogenase-like protein
MPKKVLIIGGGMAGLSAGTYLRMNGYDTHIYEMHDVPGGLCTSWQRGDYTVDLCVHWLVGSGPNDSFYDRWNELIDMEQIRFVDHEEYMRIEDEQGQQLIIYTDVDRLEAELLAKAPEDATAIREFTGAIRKLASMEMDSSLNPELANLWQKLKALWKMLPFMGLFGKYMRVSAREYAEQFRNPLLRRAMTQMFEPEMAVIFQMLTLAWMHKKAAGYPIGGSMRFALQLARRYRRLGGHIHYRQRVEKILTEGGRALGIRLADGTEIRGDYVISAADGHTTLYRMLEGRYFTPKLERFYQNMPTFPSLIFVALGIARPMQEHPHALIFPLGAPIPLDPDTTLTELPMRSMHFDPTLAPEGKTLVTFMLETTAYAYWEELAREAPDRYQAEQDRIARAIIRALDERFGGMAEAVEMIDVATPATFMRFTGNWKGSFEGWLLTPEAGFGGLEHHLPGLTNFFMCGQWMEIGGGLPTVMRSGRTVAELICHRDDRGFAVVPARSEAAPARTPA